MPLEALARDLQLSLDLAFFLARRTPKLTAAGLARTLDALFLGEHLRALLVEALLDGTDDSLLLLHGNGDLGALTRYARELLVE